MTCLTLSWARCERELVSRTYAKAVASIGLVVVTAAKVQTVAATSGQCGGGGHGSKIVQWWCEW